MSAARSAPASRGHAALLAMVVAAAAVVLAVVFHARLSLDAGARRAEGGRLQALWLCRSAVTAGLSGAATVKTELGEATVKVTRTGGEVRCTAEVPRAGRAEVSSKAGATATWEERFDHAAK